MTGKNSCGKNDQAFWRQNILCHKFSEKMELKIEHCPMD